MYLLLRLEFGTAAQPPQTPVGEKPVTPSGERRKYYIQAKVSFLKFLECTFIYNMYAHL